MDLFIEPCCYERQLYEIVNTLEGTSRDTATFFSSGDWDLSTLISYFVRITMSCDIILALPVLDAKTLYTIDRLLSAKSLSGQTIVNHIDLITTPTANNFKLITDHLGHHSCERLNVAADQIAFRCLAVHDDRRQYLITGSMNQQTRYAKHLYTITVNKQTYNDTLYILKSITRVGRSRQTKTHQQS